jgi:hypothetical protein
MPPGVRIRGFRVNSFIGFPGGWRAQFQKVGRWDEISESWLETWISVPGWHRAFGLSTWLVSRQVRKAFRRFGHPDAILFNLPWYARVAENITGVTKSYYAYDPYRFYDWDSTTIDRLEERILGTCQVGFAVAKLLVEDLKRMSKTPVHYLPNATQWQPENTIIDGVSAATTDFQSIPKPRVGCVGQINSSAYDWGLIEQLSAKLPNVQFVFIGPRFNEGPMNGADRVGAVFARPNVHWLGAKPHNHLPAYLLQCDVLINPLLVNDHNNRRSLLRLYDYLTTNRPVVGTAIAEAFNHAPHVSIARDNLEFCRLLGEGLALKAAPDLAGRQDYIAANTWRARADEFWQRLDLATEKTDRRNANHA